MATNDSPDAPEHAADDCLLDPGGAPDPPSPPDPSGPRAGTGGHETRRLDQALVRTERFADTMLGRLRAEAPRRPHPVRNLGRTLMAIQSAWLKAAFALYVGAAGLGVAVTVRAGFSDWSAHLGFYLVLLGFLTLYVKAHLRANWLRRGLYALLTIALTLYFAWVLLDLVPERLMAVRQEPLLRPRLEGLQWPAWALAAGAGSVGLHWVLLARTRDRFRRQWGAR